MVQLVDRTLSKPQSRPSTLRTPRTNFVGAFFEHFSYELSMSTRIRFPSPAFQRDPVAFFRQILGVEPWARQIEVIEAVRDHSRVAVCSGHKVSKSHSAAGLALWFYCSFEDARVVMTSTTSRQVDQILWRELRMLRSRAGRCVDCKTEDPDGLLIRSPCPHSTIIEGEQGELARTGLKTPDFREVLGFTAREAEAVSGVSGRHLLYIVDEASGVAEEIFQAIEGNRAGGAKIVMFSNGTKNEGEFYEAFYGKAHLYKTLRISSDETPNAVSGELLIPGLATREWVEEKKLEWGETSALYRVRVKGEHALHEEGRIFTIHAIGQAEARWADTAESGRLYIGLDPAGESGTGDETVLVARRGLKMLELIAQRGLNDEAHKALLLHVIKRLRLPRETPVVVIDREGSIGAQLSGALNAHVALHPNDFELVSLRASDGAIRQPQVYDRVRDELAANLEIWFRDGGAILEDAKLARELHVLEWLFTQRGRVKLIAKDKLRKILGRSPDRYDALAMSCWEPLSLADVPASMQADTEDSDRMEHVLDPYEGMKVWES
jgi:phage terminase large subunit